MGTRSLTHVKNSDGDTLVTIYRQMDGYPSGMGQDLADFLGKATVVNGIGSNQKNPEFFNGMSCMAAWLVAALKVNSGIGGIYLYPSDSTDCGEEYIYTLTLGGEGNIGFSEERKLMLKCECIYEGGQVLYDGPISEFNGEQVEKDNDEDEDAA